MSRETDPFDAQARWLLAFEGVVPPRKLWTRGYLKRAGFPIELMGSNVQQTVQKLVVFLRITSCPKHQPHKAPCHVTCDEASTSRRNRHTVLELTLTRLPIAAIPTPC
jgi:hypothetical protein